MNYYAKHAILFMIAVLLSQYQSFGQEKNNREEYSNRESIIREIEAGIIRGDVSAFSRYFDANIYLTMRNGETGYFSANQAGYILQSYFGAHRLMRFRFSTINISDIPIYATGGGTFQYRGSQEQAQIYIAVSHNKGRYVITQFCIY